jgi:hypothetical protein
MIRRLGRHPGPLDKGRVASEDGTVRKALETRASAATRKRLERLARVMSEDARTLEGVEIDTREGRLS